MNLSSGHPVLRAVAFASLTAGLALGVAACGPQGGPQGPTEAENEAQSQCYAAAHRQRGTEVDLCLADCMEAGWADDIGGGCYHFCGLPDEDPPGLDSCSIDAVRRQLERDR